MSVDNKASSVFESTIKIFLEPVWHLLKDEKITEVMINSYNERSF